MTFRMRGHEEASGTKYVPKALMDQWAKKDPVENFENFLIEQNILDQEKLIISEKVFKKRLIKVYHWLFQK